MDAPAVAVAADSKTLAVAWMDHRHGDKQKDVWWRFEKAGVFSADAALADSLEGVQAHPALTVDASGTVHAAWEDGRGVPTIVYYANSDKRGNIALAENLRCGFPSIASGRNFVVVVYETAGETVVCRVIPR